jgi:carbamoyl-phosphate synthase small subunit
MKDNSGTEVTILLEKGGRFEGRGFGNFQKIRGGEFVFCTAMTGVEESLTDPSFAGQVIVTTGAHVGNTGYTRDDDESTKIWAEGLVCRHLEHEPSNWRARQSVPEWIVGQDRFVIEGIDTRELTILLRNQGSQRGIVIPRQSEKTSNPVALINEYVPDMNGRDLTLDVTGAKRPFEDPAPKYWPVEKYSKQNGKGKRHTTTSDTKKLSIAVWDFGVKTNTLRLLRHLGGNVTVLPATAKATELLEAGRDGILLSNGPGDPAAATHIIQELKALLGRRAIFSICLGHQLVALASGARTYKMKFGHRGIHHPVVELNEAGKSVRTWITSQNHGFAVDPETLKGSARVSFVHADDQTVEGLSLPDLNCETVQFHPEAAPGPYDAVVLLSRFINRIQQQGKA